MKIALFAGSFDPITKGHISIIENASYLFDKIIVAVSYNINKKSFLSVEERIALILQATQNFSNIEVDSFEGLTVNFAQKSGANTLIRGIRNTTDFEYEKQLAQINSKLNPNIKTIFLLTEQNYSHISSSAVREIWKHKGDFSSFVPESVYNYLISRYDDI